MRAVASGSVRREVVHADMFVAVVHEELNSREKKLQFSAFRREVLLESPLLPLE